MKRSTRREREKDRELVRRIRDAGIPIFIDTDKDEEPELLIRQDFDAYESIVFDVNGGAGLVLPLRITPSIPVFVFSGFDIRLPRWPNAWLRPLEESDGGQWPHYQFYGRSEMKFDRSETINRLIAEQKEFRPGHPFRGLLLAFSYDPIPDEIVRGEILRGSIKIFDQFDHEHCAKIALRVDREAEREFRPKHRGQRLLARPSSKARADDAEPGRGSAMNVRSEFKTSPRANPRGDRGKKVLTNAPA